MLKETGMPAQCVRLEETIYLEGSPYLFLNNSALPWIMISIYIIAFMVPIIYIWKNRKLSSFSTRSPKLIMLGFLLMMLDCIFNTNLMSETPHEY